MQESEFRDWARRAQGSFDERLKVLERRVGEIELAPVRVRTPGAYKEFEGLLGKVRDEIARGLVTGLAVAVVREDGEVLSGWKAEGFDEYALIGALSQLNLGLMDRAKTDVEAAGAASGETGQTDEGNPGRPEAREVGASAPAGGA